MKEEKTEEQKMPWLDRGSFCETRLTKEAMDHLWDMVNQRPRGPLTMNSAGPNNKVYDIEDKNDWFFENVLKECSERLYYKDWNNYYKVHIEHSIPPTLFELRLDTKGIMKGRVGKMWVNHFKQHEYLPPHSHIGLFSFVVFMKIPTHWKEQHALPWLINSGPQMSAQPSDFQFILGQSMGTVQQLQIPLCPEDEGRMLFFPSLLSHQVFPFYECEEERITISGNIHPKINANT
jgi:hypothetical protein